MAAVNSNSNTLASKDAISGSSNNNNSNSNKGKKVFSRLFKRRKAQPLSEQDSASHKSIDFDDYNNDESFCSTTSNSDKENLSSFGSDKKHHQQQQQQGLGLEEDQQSGIVLQPMHREQDLFGSDTGFDFEVNYENTKDFNFDTDADADADDNAMVENHDDKNNTIATTIFQNVGCNPFEQTAWKRFVSNKNQSKSRKLTAKFSPTATTTNTNSKVKAEKSKDKFMKKLQVKVEPLDKELENSSKKIIDLQNKLQQNKATSAVISSLNNMDIGNSSISNNNNNSSSNSKDTNKMILTRSALSRPFGRTSLPAHIAKQWCAEVSPFYDASHHSWKYHILVQKEEYSTMTSSSSKTNSHTHAHTLPPPPSMPSTNGTNANRSARRNSIQKDTSKLLSSPTSVIAPSNNQTGSGSGGVIRSFVAANVTRTLKDLLWLERALKDEFHGALLFPTLSMTLTSGTDWTSAASLDKEVFERGEWDPIKESNQLLEVILEDEEDGFDCHEEEDDDDNGGGNKEKRPPIDPKLLSDWLNDIMNGVRGKGELILNYTISNAVDVMNSEAMESFLYRVNTPLVDLHFMKKINKGDKKWLPVRLDLRSLPTFKEKHHDGNEMFGPCTFKDIMLSPLACINACNSELESGGFDDYDDDETILSRRDKMNAKQHNPPNLHHSMLSDELNAQRYFIALQRENTLRAMYRLRMLLTKEDLVSTAWKRFAISLSNLFMAGKDIENCKIGDSKQKKPKSKVNKEIIDDNLRSLARQKVDRATPSLKVLSGMLSAYYADYSSVDPSLCAFSDGLKRLEMEKAELAGRNEENWKTTLTAVSPIALFKDSDGIKDTKTHEIEMRVFEERQNFNERLMKSSLLQLCNSIGIRVARMSWKFFKMESGQASLLSAAAEEVQQQLQEDLCQEENKLEEVETKDNGKELVKQLLDLASTRKYKYYPRSKSCSSSHTGSESDTFSENDSACMEESIHYDDNFDEVMELVTQNSGNWDHNLAIAILEASGIENPEILIDDATREVRAARKLSENLRVNVDRCAEAISMLKDVAYEDQRRRPNKGRKKGGRVIENRKRFLSDLAVLFSGTLYKMTDASSKDHKRIENTLKNIGMHIHDSAGWLTIVDMKDCHGNVNNKGRCGQIASRYLETREKDTLKVLEQMNIMLIEQCKYIQCIDSFLYMHCVGIQIEKHYSKLRSDALAAWEKKTDITTAINIATKKRLDLLVQELRTKLASLSSVTHTSVKEAKERHLGSKALKTELESLACQRFQQVKELSTKNVVSTIRQWAIHEENVAKDEIQCLSDAIKEIERVLRQNEKMIKADGGAHLFASSGVG